jgi:hypothetical protein
MPSPVLQGKRRRSVQPDSGAAERSPEALRCEATPGVARQPRTERSITREGVHMFRKPSCNRTTIVAAAIAAICTTATAFADDSSMSRLTGDSYAFFNDLDYSAGKFNVARAPRPEGRDALAKGSSKDGRDADSPIVSSTRAQAAKPSGPLRDDRGS